eukprot:Seg1064.3 transcript_id=Seg1064.3/GoldUCD/mRNA.D3Y31 product="hypothetical protein" protein_id=Seg1064.3/GoldUCD/D3Y31
MAEDEEVEVWFQGDNDILEFISAVDEQDSMNNEVGEAAIDVSRDFSVSYPLSLVALLTRDREVARSQPEKECQFCNKKFKTPAGLTRHSKLKHTEVALEPERIRILLYHACNDISKDKCYGEVLMSPL